MKQGGIGAWNIAPLFKGNAAPFPRPACTLSAAPAPCPGPPAPCLHPDCASAARSLLGLAAPCPRPACSPAPCPCPTAALCPGQGWQLPAPVPHGTLCCPACPWLPACVLLDPGQLLDPHLRGILPAPPGPVPCCQLSPPCPVLPGAASFPVPFPPALPCPVRGCQLPQSCPCQFSSVLPHPYNIPHPTPCWLPGAHRCLRALI